MGNKYKNAVKRYSGTRDGVRALLFMIADHADDDGMAFPGDELLADELGVNVKTVERRMKKLLESGELEQVSGGRGYGQKRVLRILIDPELTRQSVRLKPDNLSGYIGELTRQSVPTNRTDCPNKPDNLSGSPIYKDLTRIEPAVEPTREPPIITDDPDSFSVTPTAPKTPPRQKVRKPRRTATHFDPRRIVNGLFPPGEGSNAVEVFREFFTSQPTARQMADLNRDVTDLKLWRTTCQNYSNENLRDKRGNPIVNLSWLLERYGNGGVNPHASNRRNSATGSTAPVHNPASRGALGTPPDPEADAEWIEAINRNRPKHVFGRQPAAAAD